MIASASRIWTPRPDACNQSPFRTGVDRALANAFPPANGVDLPERIVSALARLERALAVCEASTTLEPTLP